MLSAHTFNGSLEPSTPSESFSYAAPTAAPGVFVGRRLSRLVMRLSRPDPGVFERSVEPGTASVLVRLAAGVVAGGGVAKLARLDDHKGRVEDEDAAALAVDAARVADARVWVTLTSGAGPGVFARELRVVRRVAAADDVEGAATELRVRALAAGACAEAAAAAVELRVVLDGRELIVRVSSAQERRGSRVGCRSCW